LSSRTTWPTDAREVFNFAGAGLSRSSPTALPVFDGLRDVLLRGLDLEQYVPVWGTDLTSAQRRIKGIQPEPFFAALESAGVDTQAWLVEALSPADALPNAAHRAVAELYLAGARTWTVNFDTGLLDERRIRLDHLAFRVADRHELQRWATHLEAKGVTHSGIIDTGFGPTVVFRDPDNMQLEFYVHPSADEVPANAADSDEAQRVLHEAQLATDQGRS
jgi:catechol 2,3-dioxygenase-like lactoylglutathione lyase family enzyme